MKVVIILTLVLLCVVLVAGSTCSIQIIRPQSEENRITHDNQPVGATQGNSLPTSDAVQSESSQLSGLPVNQSAGNLRSINGIVSSRSSLETPNNQNTIYFPGEGTTSENASPPDGRIYLGGEAPYAYVPTYSPKQKGLPIIPLTPDD